MAVIHIPRTTSTQCFLLLTIAVSDFSISLIRSFLNRYVSIILFFLNHLQAERFDEGCKFLLL